MISMKKNPAQSATLQANEILEQIDVQKQSAGGTTFSGDI